MSMLNRRNHRYGTRKRQLPNYAEEFKKADEMLSKL